MTVTTPLSFTADLLLAIFSWLLIPLLLFRWIRFGSVVGLRWVPLFPVPPAADPPCLGRPISFAMVGFCVVYVDCGVFGVCVLSGVCGVCGVCGVVSCGVCGICIVCSFVSVSSSV